MPEPIGVTWTGDACSMHCGDALLAFRGEARDVLEMEVAELLDAALDGLEIKPGRLYCLSVEVNELGEGGG